MNEDEFLQNMMNLIQREMPKNLEKLRVINEKEFSVNPTEVNAYNSFADNSISEYTLRTRNFSEIHIETYILISSNIKISSTNNSIFM